MLGLTQVQMGSYVTLCISCVQFQSNASVGSSENSTTLLGCQALDLISSDSSLCCPVWTGHSRHPWPIPSSSPFFQLFSRSLTTSGHFKIAGPKSFVWFRAKTDKGIVCLADHLYSVTVILSASFRKIINYQYFEDIWNELSL